MLLQQSPFRLSLLLDKDLGRVQRWEVGCVRKNSIKIPAMYSERNTQYFLAKVTTPRVYFLNVMELLSILINAH